jgi:large subunit ribosomal protein L16
MRRTRHCRHHPRRNRSQSNDLAKEIFYAIDAQTREVSQDPAGEPQGDCFAQLRIDFGEFGLQTLERAWITNTQIEAARVALTRNMKRKGKLWIRIFPDKSVTARPPETRMGKGKGQPEKWVATVKPGYILFELDGVPESVARESLRLAADKLPVRTKFLTRHHVAA